MNIFQGYIRYEGNIHLVLCMFVRFSENPFFPLRAHTPQLWNNSVEYLAQKHENLSISLLILQLELQLLLPFTRIFKIKMLLTRNTANL